MNYDLYEVGGRIRDYYLGLESKDIDYTVVIRSLKLYNDPYDEFVKQIEDEGYDIYENKKSMFTVRARFPIGHQFEGLTADFVIARKELGYTSKSRLPLTKYGSLEDDLIRRDFTVNALAKNKKGKIIDLFNGLKDLNDRILRTPTDTAISFNQDPLRILRAFRFSITKGLSFSDEITSQIQLFDTDRMKIVSKERIRNELIKMFKYNTPGSLRLLYGISNLNSGLYEYIINIDRLWFKPTFEK